MSEQDILLASKSRRMDKNTQSEVHIESWYIRLLSWVRLPLAGKKYRTGVRRYCGLSVECWR
jgi:hypothetical protein